MASTVVQFREPMDAVEWLRARGINPNEFARQAFEGRLRRIRLEENWKELRSHGIRLPKRAAEIIREERENH